MTVATRRGPALRLADHVFWAPTPNGAHMLTPHGEFPISGASIGVWLDRLAPHLDGQHTLEDLTATVDAERAALLTRLVTTLTERGVILEVPSDTADADQSPGMALRTATVVALGPPELTALARRGCLLAGAGAVFESTGSGDLSTTAPDVIIHLDRYEAGQRWDEVTQWATDHDAVLAQIVLMGQEVWACPPHRPARGDHGWVQVRRRLLPWLEHRPATATQPFPADLVVVVNRLIRRISQDGATVTPAHPEAYEPATAQTRTHRMLPPAPPSPDAGLTARIHRLEALPPMTQEEFSRRAFQCADPRTGIFDEITEGDFAQSPIQVASARVADPSAAGHPLTVYGCGVDLTESRCGTARAALTHYAVRAAEEALAGHSATPAWDLIAGRGTTIATNRAFPEPDGLGEADGALPVGASAAYSWQDAVRQGLLAHCRALTLHWLLATGIRLTPLDLTAAQSDTSIAYAMGMLNASGAAVSLAATSGPLGVPLIACAVDGTVVAYSCASTPLAAVRETLLTALRSRQSSITGQEAYAPQPVPQVPLAGGAARPLRTDAPEVTLPQLIRQLQEQDMHAYAIPLDHDRDLHAVMPFIVNVVVSES